jgi:hypothetical protein
VTTTHNPEKGPRNLSCEAWEAMLADALDGTLDAREAAAFEAHSRSCGAGCAELLEEAKRGTEWLRFLHETPEAPQGLLERILAETAGLETVQQPLAVAGVPAMAHQPWLGVSIGVLQRHVMESRILMTLAMAFFSIALTLNLTGVHLNQLRLSDLRPSALATSLSHQYYTTWGHLNRYYSNLRIVYELESRVNEMRQNTSAPQSRPAQQPQAQPQKQQPQAQPSNGGKPGGSAQKTGGGAAATPELQQRRYEDPAPVLAEFDAHAGRYLYQHPRLRLWAHRNIFSSGLEVFTSRPGNYHEAFSLLTRAAEIRSACPFLTERSHKGTLGSQHLQEKCLTPSERSLA